jgi:hypothetical protein
MLEMFEILAILASRKAGNRKDIGTVDRIPKLDVTGSNPSPASNSHHHWPQLSGLLIVHVQQFSTPPCFARSRQSKDLQRGAGIASGPSDSPRRIPANGLARYNIMGGHEARDRWRPWPW